METFQHEVDFIHSLPALLLIEIFGLWLPLAFHAVLGVYFARTGHSNVSVRVPVQLAIQLAAITGYVAFVFIFMHVASLRWGWSFWGLMPTFDPQLRRVPPRSTSRTVRGDSFAAVFYLVGVLAIVFHFANGLWTAAITWGLTISATSQRSLGRVAPVRASAWPRRRRRDRDLGFATLNPEEAEMRGTRNAGDAGRRGSRHGSTST